MTAWFLLESRQRYPGIVFADWTTVAGLKFDVNDNGLSYNWNDDDAASNFKSDSEYRCFSGHVALIVQPDQAFSASGRRGF
jgi:hypothetical protein